MLQWNQNSFTKSCKLWIFWHENLKIKNLFSNGPKEKEKVKSNFLTNLLSVLLRLIQNENKQSLSRMLDNENNFSFFNSEFLDIAALRIFLVSDEAGERESYKAMSKSFGFLRNTSNLADFKNFGQTTDFGNMKFPLLDHYKHPRISLLQETQVR